jgi:prevent-host-death family protein
MSKTPRQPKQARVSKSALGSAEFKARCLELIDHVKESRAEYIVTRHGRPMAMLVPVRAEAKASIIGCMQGTVLAYDGPFDPVPAVWSIDSTDELPPRKR